MAVGILFILSVLVFLSLNTVTIGIKDRGQNTKRILLNDQDVAGQINRDIQSLRQLVNTMKNDMDTQKAKIASQEAEIASQRLEIASQKTKMSSLEVEIISQKTEIASQKAQSAIQQAELARLNVTTPDAGSTYIRWGRTSCSAPGTKMVYTGYAAGQHYNQYSNRFGGPANMLCLPNDPELSNLSTASDSFLWGTEFDENMLKSDAANEDVPCAVCKSTNTHVSIMIPGRLSCYVGWKREYNGVLASDYYGNSASSFICIDIYPDYVPGGQADNNGRLLYFTSIKCGALSCPPYKDGKAVNCVVCSQ